MGNPVGETFTITDLASEFDITPRTIRFYEDKGLLSPERQGQNRIYSRRDRARLKLILRGRRVGFSLAVIREMLDLYDLGDDQEEQVRFTLARSTDRLAELEQQRRDINEIIQELKESIEGIHQWLAEKGEGCPVAKQAAANRAAEPASAKAARAAAPAGKRSLARTP